MADQDNNETIYIIPENYIDESRIIKGMFKTRFFIEGLIFGLIFLFIGHFVIKTESFDARITIDIFFAAFPFMIGVHGINGDPVSVYVKNAFKWLLHKKIMLYNDKPQPLTESPLDSVFHQTMIKDKLLQVFDNMREKQYQKKIGETFVQGENFEFSKDVDIADLVVDEKKIKEKPVEIELEIVEDEEDEVELTNPFEIVIDREEEQKKLDSLRSDLGQIKND